MKYKKDKIDRAPVSLLLNEDLLNKVKVYCMFKKKAFSTTVEDLLLTYYLTHKEDVDKANNLYDSIEKNN